MFSKKIKAIFRKSLLYMLIGSMVSGAVAFLSPCTVEAEAASYTCPIKGGTLTQKTTYSYDPNTGGQTIRVTVTAGKSGSVGTSSSSIFVSLNSLPDVFGGALPKVGDTFSLTQFQGTSSKYITVPVYGISYTRCSVCGSYKGSPNGTGNYIDKWSDFYEIAYKYDKTTKTYTISSVREYTAEIFIAEKYPEYQTSDKAAEYTHTYTISHNSHSNSCKERVHTHKTNEVWNTYEYTCDCTLTNRERFRATLTATESANEGYCGHVYYYDESIYTCRMCGEEVYYTYKEGCERQTCDYYYKNQYYVEGTHPGTHTYKKQGIRYVCENTTGTFQDGNWYTEDGEPHKNRDTYCNRCGYCMYTEYDDNYGINGFDDVDFTQTVTPYKHYYYLPEFVAEGACYTYDTDNIHYATSPTSERENDYYDCDAKTHKNYYTNYSCNICGLALSSIYNAVSCSSCDDTSHKEYDTEFSSLTGYAIGKKMYDYTTDPDDFYTERANNSFLHMKKTLICTTAEYGDVICNKVVTNLVPVESSQTIEPGGTINTKAYAKFQDGHLEEVTCAISYNANLYNQDQTATLSYGEFSAVDSHTPRTATITLHLVRKEADVTVVVSPEGAGSATGTGTYMITQDVSVSANAAPGYAFKGWYDGTTLKSSAVDYTFTMPASNLTLTATFTPKNYALNVYSEFPSMGTVSSVTSAAYKSSVTVTATPKSGFKFAGWYDGANLVSQNASYTFTMPYYAYSLMARFTSTDQTVSFNSNGGSACSSIKVQYLGTYGKLPIPTKAGYVFQGWQYNGAYVTELTPVTTQSNHTLTAVWTVAGPEFLLIDYGNKYGKNSWSLDNQNVGVLGLTSARLGAWLPEPVKSGYTFKGWSRTENVQGNGDYTDTSRLVTKDTVMNMTEQHTLHAGWNENTYTLSFDSNGGTSCGNMSITYDRSYGYTSSLPTPTKSGYTFAGWWTSELDNNGIGTQIENNTRVQTVANQTLYAKWTQNAVNITVQYDARTKEQVGLTPAESAALGYGSTIGTITSGQASSSVSYPGTYGNYPITWCGCDDSATHSSSNGWKSYGNRHYYVDTSKTAGFSFPVATRTGYTFKQWELDGSKVSLATETKYAQNHTIYATYTPNTYTITFNPNGGTVSTASKTVTFDKPYGAFPTPNRAGYVFEGWYTAASGGTKVADNIAELPVTTASNQTFYAHWKEGNFKLSLDYNGGTKGSGDSSPYTVTLNSGNYNDISWGLPTRRGYNFQGFYTAASGGTQVYTAAGKCANDGTYWKNGKWNYPGDVTLYAQWAIKEFDITLNGRGATGINHTKTVHMTYFEKGGNVTPPTKTGYTFRGYYTGIRGTGTKYYNTSGVCIKEWTEDDKNELFAYWTQNEVILPEVGDQTEPTPLPEMDFEGSVGRTDAKGLLYADDYNPATDALNDLQPYLTYDTPSSEGIIPGTEEIAFRAKMGSWMLHYKLHKNTGTDYVRFYVTVSYRTQYERSSDEELVISEQQTKTYTFSIPKAWSYWEIMECGLYYPDKVTIINDGLKNGILEVSVDRKGNSAVIPPSYEVEQYGDKENHVFWEEYDTDGTPILRITLEEEQYIISDVHDTLPDIDLVLKGSCLAAVQKDERQAKVRSDRFILNNQIILSDAWNNTGNSAAIDRGALEEFSASGGIEKTSYVQTYRSGLELDERALNGRYVSRAEISYIGDTDNINVSETLSVTMDDINDLNIHTPVVCKGVVEEGMEQTEDGYDLVLKKALNYFTLSVDNYGTHRMSFGYGTKDFSTALSGNSNIAMQDGKCLNQVQFPFDVYVDAGNDFQREGDYILAAGTWFTIGRSGQQFYVPVTMKNGEYQIKCRSIAVNCPRDVAGEYIISEEGQQANLSPDCYVAADVINLEIKSYLRDFNITSVNATTTAKQLKAGCQALILKKGYGFSFELLTQGEFYGENANINIVPTYFWESADGLVRKEVKLYHLGDFLQDAGRECTAWEGEPLLLNHENFDVIVQQFKGEAMVPADILCVDKDFPLEEYATINTFTGKEEFFLREGYLIIHFDITVQSNEGVPYVFERWDDTEPAKDAKEQGWNYIPGDIIRYDLSKSIADDYEIGGSE